MTDTSEPNSDGKAAKQAGEIDALARQPLIERSSNINEATRKRKSRKRTAPPKATEAALPSLPGLKFARHPAGIDAEAAAYTSSLTALVGPIEDFQQWTDERAKRLKLRKVGEGSYGEVYRATAPSGESVIFKLVPLRARKGPGSKSHTAINDAVNEVRLLERMCEVPGLVEYRGGAILIGRVPATLVSEWHAYKQTSRTAEAKNPAHKSSYPASQLWLALEMSDAGEDLSHYRPPGAPNASFSATCLSVQRIWDIFWQVVGILARAESHAQFEHRDLHFGNICIRDTRHQPDAENLELVSNKDSTPFKLDNTGLQVTIIDYTLARATVMEDHVLSTNLSQDKDLIWARDQTYRYMEEVVGLGGWREFRPETNVLWLQQLVEKLLDKATKLSKDAWHTEGGNVTVTRQMRQILENVKGMIRREEWGKWKVRSATDLLDLSVQRGWLKLEEFVKG